MDSEPEQNDPHESFLRLWTRHEPEFRAYIRACGLKAQEVDEVLQNVSIAAWRKFSSLEDHAAFGKWACVIARYEILMARRSIARDRLVLSEKVMQRLADEGTEELSLRHQQLEVLDFCIAKLPEERQELALAAYGKEISIRNLAGKLKRSEGSLYQLLARIRKQLYTCVEQNLPHSS